MIFITLLVRDPQLFFLILLSVVPSICLHEYAHAQVALWNGDPTAAIKGHLTLNPLKQMGWISVVVFLLLGIAWGQVPVDPRNLSKKGRLLTAFAGPGMNLLLFGAAWIAFGVLYGADLPNALKSYILVAGTYNMVLFLFNMLPVPGLDGWNILRETVKLPRLESETLKGVMLFFIFAAIFAFQWFYEFAHFLMACSPAVFR